jgi:small-conductance mechanosensitive channel
MNVDQLVPDRIQEFLPLIVSIACFTCLYALLSWIRTHKWRKHEEGQFRFQLITTLLFLIGIVVIIVSLPISETMRGQLLGLLGILLSAAIALSSTTFVGNMLAGVMLRTIRSARPGDFIQIQEVTGRITEMDLLHTEVQTEDRDLMTIPNLLLASQPVKVVRSTGTIISAEVSLGYDVPQSKIKTLLIQAGETVGLADVFVQVRELGDFSVVYRVAGLLEDVSALISMRAKLRSSMLDVLHDNDIEIVSPNFMNTRALSEKMRFLPENTAYFSQHSEELGQAETLAFDKADAASELESLKKQRKHVQAQISALDKKSPHYLALNSALEIKLKRLNELLEDAQKKKVEEKSKEQ